MKLKAIAESVKGFVSSTTWKIEKHSPEILLVAGIAATIAGVVTACRATLKVPAVIEEHKADIETIEKQVEKGTDENGEEYTQSEAKKDTAKTVLRTFTKVTRLYLLSIILIGLSIFCQIKGYKTLSQRLAAASAAYAALAAKFKDYRKRIVDRIGAEEEREIYNHTKAKEITTTGIDENGNPIEGKEIVYVEDDDDYTALFSQFDKNGVLNLAWDQDSEQNLTWLTMRQNWWNNVLKCRKGRPVTLNEIREDLGLGRTQKGQAVGWVYAPDNPKHQGDNYIDFGIDRIIKAYRNGDEMPEESIMLDFNVDGNIIYAF